jgi:hypothetical protein
MVQQITKFIWKTNKRSENRFDMKRRKQPHFHVVKSKSQQRILEEKTWEMKIQIKKNQLTSSSTLPEFQIVSRSLKKSSL